MLETLRLENISFRSMTEVLDTTTPQGRLVFHMFGAIAEFIEDQESYRTHLV
jgi:DNA invertase Pin-like site-specific DNA recombinase